MSAPARSRRAWGWHRLTDDWAARVVADAGVRPGELVLDIGAGQGALTDAALLRLPRRPYRVVASPPYAISSPLLRMLLAPGVDSAVLVVRRR